MKISVTSQVIVIESIFNNRTYDRDTRARKVWALTQTSNHFDVCCQTKVYPFLTIVA
jgi:hypothetical protein